MTYSNTSPIVGGLHIRHIAVLPNGVPIRSLLPLLLILIILFPLPLILLFLKELFNVSDFSPNINSFVGPRSQLFPLDMLNILDKIALDLHCIECLQFDSFPLQYIDSVLHLVKSGLNDLLFIIGGWEDA